MSEKIQKLYKLIDVVISENGSDLHLSTGSRPIIRSAGSLIPLTRESILTNEEIVEFLDEFLNQEQKEVFFEKQSYDFSYSYQDDKARFRGSVYFFSGKIAIALRLIPASPKSLEELNLPNEIEQFAHMQQGFFLVVGPVGQGKTTTLASLINIVNMERAEHIVTIENPIEYVFKSEKSMIHQREVKIDTSDFASALNSVFREDVDVLMIGEMRGIDTISAAVTAAETGHLVYSTLHTNDAAQTIDRIIDSFPANQQGQIRMQLAGSLAGIFSQRLVPRVSSGLIPAYELLINTKAVSNLIREKRTHEINTIIETGTEQGMVSMNRSLVDLVRKGEITADIAYQYSLNPQSLEQLL